MNVKPRKATCKVCGGTWTHKRPGPLPWYCARHKPSRNRARQAAEAEARGELAEAEAIRTSAVGTVQPHEETSAAVAPALMALGLGLNSDPARAASLAGLTGLTKRELTKLERAARTEYSALLDGSASAVAAAGFSALGMAVLRTIEGLPRISPSQRANAASHLVNVLERLATAAKPSFGAMRIELVERKDDDK